MCRQRLQLPHITALHTLQQQRQSREREREKEREVERLEGVHCATEIGNNE